MIHSAFCALSPTQALLHICGLWHPRVGHPSEVMMVGDSARDDIVCGNRAGAVTTLLASRDQQGLTQQSLPVEQQPTHIVRSLPELSELLMREYDLAG
jgi:ribonucleotide monophosphatase NagD (HAD superfamily)